MLNSDVVFTTKFDLTLTNKGVVVTDDIDYAGIGEDINNYKGVLVISGPLGVIYSNTDYDNPDIIPGTSRESIIDIPLPLDPQTDYDTVLKGNYTVRYTVQHISTEDEYTNLDTYSYQFEEPEIETTIVSGPYSGTLTSTDDTDYGSNITSLNREHRLQYPNTRPEADIVSSNAEVQVSPIFTNEWTIIITSTVEYTNPDTLQIKWSDMATFTHCVYAGCVSGMYDAIEIMRDSFSEAILEDRVQAEDYERRLVLVNTAWHLLNVAYQDGDVEEADEQANIIAEQIAYTGLATCGEGNSEEVTPCPAWSGGGSPASYTFQDGVVEASGVVRIGGTLTQNRTLNLAGYDLLFSGVSGSDTASVSIGTDDGVLLKHSDGSTEGRIYATSAAVELERADVGTPANTRGYQITSAGLVEKGDYRSGYGARTLVSKEYVDAAVGISTVVSDATLTGTGVAGDPLAVATPFPGFTDLNTDYGYTEPTHAFSEITATPTTLAGYGITDAVEDLTDLGDFPSSYSGQAGNILVVNAGESGMEFSTAGGWVASTGGQFTGVVTFYTSDNYPVILKQSGAGGTPGTPEAGTNKVAFQDSDGDLQGEVGIGSGGNLELRSYISGKGIVMTGSAEASTSFKAPIIYVDDTASTISRDASGNMVFEDANTTQKTLTELAQSAVASSMIGLNDTPSSYSGEAGKIMQVNDAEDAMEFIDGLIMSPSYTSCPASATTNINIGDSGDRSLLIHYIATRDMGTVYEQSGLVIIQYDPVTGTANGRSSSYVGPEIGMEIEADYLGGNLRLNIIVDNQNANALSFAYKVYSKFTS